MAAVSTMPILIVDDYNTTVRILRNLLRRLGFTNIDEANDGAAALAKIRTKRYGLVISDAKMAQMDIGGLQDIGAPQFLTIASDADEGAAAHAYVATPVTADMLKAKLEQALGAF